MMAKMMTTSPPPSSPPLTPPPPTTTSLPIRTIPGGYGWPILGPISDRLNYFWLQGPEKFFRKRIEKHKSTVFRTNIPPTFPFFVGVNPNVVAVLDCKAFSHLFDMELVDKRDVLVGDFMPSVSYTGGQRVCAYLDTSEPKHSKVKNFMMDILKRSSTVWVSTLYTTLDSMWDSIESSLSTSPSVGLVSPVQKFLFTFLARTLIGADPNTSPEISSSGYNMISLWLAFQLLPTVNINKLQPLEEVFLHSFSYPFSLVSGGYNKVAKFIEEEGKEVIERGVQEFGLTKEEAIHNLLFTFGFNAYGGFSVFLPTLFSALGTDSEIQEKLREEVRSHTSRSTLDIHSVKELKLVQSFVYETLRLNPPVPTQFARARKDFVLSSHKSAYKIRKGELLCGYQALVMRDPEIFENPESFVLDRFAKENGSELLNYLYWSNGPQTGSPSESNKQCAAKDLVPLTATLLVAHLFSRYDAITIDSSGSITAVKKAKTN